MKVNIDGKEMEATAIRYRPDSNGEPWTEYLLEDGSSLRFRSVVVSIVRVNNAWTPNGEPVYQWQAQTSTIVISPDHMKQPSIEKPVLQ